MALFFLLLFPLDEFDAFAALRELDRLHIFAVVSNNKADAPLLEVWLEQSSELVGSVGRVTVARQVYQQRLESTQRTVNVHCLAEVDSLRLRWFRTLLLKIKSEDINLVCILPPYHPIVSEFFESNSQYAIIRQTQEAVQKICKELNVKVIGSYFSKDIGFESKDFFDGMHIKKSSVSKLLLGIGDGFKR